jgi:thiaminase
MLLTKHEGETFLNQTVYISGQAFIRCSFVACTLVLRETVYHLEACTFERCNWHVDWVLMWGSPESLREIKALVNMIENAQASQQATAGAAAGAQPARNGPSPFSGPRPPSE